MIILASKSPRRKELMTKYITSHFSIIPSSYEEEIDNNISPIDNVLNISKHKGEEIFNEHRDDVVISCDTIVVLNNEIFGKPKDKEDAIDTIMKLAGKTHEVISAYSIFYKEIEISRYVISKVTFKNINKDQAKEYIEKDNPLDKAGSYGIQDKDSYLIIEKYEGSLNNIIGFPVEEIKKDLEGFNILD